MHKRWVSMLALVVVAGCSRGAASTRAAAAHTRQTATRRLAGSWSTPLAGSPGDVATDRAGVIVMIDDDTVVALDERGHNVWSTPVPGAGLGRPSLGGGIVVVPTLRDEGGPGGCVALDRNTGARLWAYEEKAAEGVAVAPAGPNVICALGNGVVVSVDRRSGVVRWRHALASTAHATVVIAERSALAVDDATGTIVITMTANSGSVIETLAVATGADAGMFDLGGLGPLSPPVLVGPGLVAVGISRGAEVCTFDLRRRSRRACVQVTAPDGFDPAGIPLVAGGLLLLAARDGSVSAVDLATMKVRWSKRGPNPILAVRPESVGGVVMFSDWSRRAWARRLADGREVGIPAGEGWAVATVADPRGGFDVAKRDMDGGWIEHWIPVV